MILFKAEASAWTPSAVQLQQVWVDPEARRQGFATRALRDLAGSCSSAHRPSASSCGPRTGRRSVSTRSSACATRWTTALWSSDLPLPLEALAGRGVAAGVGSGRLRRRGEHPLEPRDVRAPARLRLVGEVAAVRRDRGGGRPRKRCLPRATIAALGAVAAAGVFVTIFELFDRARRRWPASTPSARSRPRRPSRPGTRRRRSPPRWPSGSSTRSSGGRCSRWLRSWRCRACISECITPATCWSEACSECCSGSRRCGSFERLHQCPEHFRRVSSRSERALLLA